jgi:very-short-patch-repair endonuclease
VFLRLLAAHGLPRPETEVCFIPGRRFRADYCWRAEQLIVEREGGIWRGGRHPRTGVGGHSSGRGIARDMDKGNAAVLAGWRVLRFEPRALDSGAAIPAIRQALEMTR